MFNIWCLTQFPAFCMLMIIFFVLFSEDAAMSVWSPFTTCSLSCGGGLKSRYRACNRSRFGGKDCSVLGPLSEEEPCNVHDCNGKLLLAWPGILQRLNHMWCCRCLLHRPFLDFLFPKRMMRLGNWESARRRERELVASEKLEQGAMGWFLAPLPNS